MKTIKLKDILSISGKGGLFRYIAQARNGIVVESLEDKKRHVAPATARVSSLEEIAIFTDGEEVPLADIFFMIHEKADGRETLSHKSDPGELTAYFEELVPEYDRERVYLSDIRKVFQWYNLMHNHQLLEVIEKEEGSEEEGSAAEEGSTAEKGSSAGEQPARKEERKTEKWGGAEKGGTAQKKGSYEKKGPVKKGGPVKAPKGTK